MKLQKELNVLTPTLFGIVCSAILLEVNTKCYMLIQCVIKFNFITLVTCSSRIKPDAAEILFKVRSKKSFTDEKLQ